MTTFAIRTSILKELFADPYWRKKFDNANTTKEQYEVAKDFCQTRGYEVCEEVALKGVE